MIAFADDVAILQLQDMSTLARWWCSLNRFGWPAGLGEPEAGDVDADNQRRSACMRAIEARIGLVACLLEWRKGLGDDLLELVAPKSESPVRWRTARWRGQPRARRDRPHSAEQPGLLFPTSSSADHTSVYEP